MTLLKSSSQNRSLLDLFLPVLALCFVSTAAQADGAAKNPKVGRKAASEYFNSDVKEAVSHARSLASAGTNYLTLQIGGFLKSESYEWKGTGKRTSVAKATYGMTYLYDEWANFDANLRVDFNEFDVDGERLTKLSFISLISLPRATNEFPLYFGLGAGLGVFFNQIEDESNLSLDYQLVAGYKWLNAIQDVGLNFEFGLKNHLHLLSSGQLNGTFFSVGTVFNF